MGNSVLSRKIDIRDVKGISIIKPLGEMNYSAVNELEDWVLKKVDEENCRFIFDLSEAVWIDAIGLGLLALAVKSALIQKTRVILVKPKAAVLKKLEDTRLTELSNLAGSVEEAIQFFERT